MAEFRPSMYKPYLEETLMCFHCHDEFRTMPKLKAHLQEEFDTLKTRGRERVAREKERLEKKRKREEKQHRNKPTGAAGHASHNAMMMRPMSRKECASLDVSRQWRSGGSPAPQVSRRVSSRGVADQGRAPRRSAAGCSTWTHVRGPL